MSKKLAVKIWVNEHTFTWKVCEDYGGYWVCKALFFSEHYADQYCDYLQEIENAIAVTVRIDEIEIDGKKITI